MFRNAAVKLLKPIAKRLPMRVRMFAVLSAQMAVKELPNFEPTKPEAWLSATKKAYALWKFSRMAPDLVVALTMMAGDPQAARVAAWKQANVAAR